MKDFYYVIDELIKNEIDMNQTIAIYPMGKVGLLAKDILVNRYGHTGIFLDNQLAQYNKEIIDIDKFAELDNANITIILCASNPILNKEIINNLREKKLKSKIMNILDVPLIQPEKKDYFASIKKLCQVKKAIGYELVRVGGHHDGGYIMLNDFENKKIAYSFGIGYDVSWEEWISRKGNIIIHCFDHTVNGLPIENDRMFFHKIGIAGVDYRSDNLLSIDSILQANAHERETDIILKMDVEGAEWDFFQTVSSDTLNRFSQMTFELHGMINRDEGKIIRALEKINKTHQAVWIHANNSGGIARAGCIMMPDLLEITYVNKQNYMFTDTSYNCPLDIDSPNIEAYPDIVLRNWGSLETDMNL